MPAFRWVQCVVTCRVIPQLLNHNLIAHCHCPPLASRPGTMEMTNRATMMTCKWYRKTGLFYMGPGLVFKLFYFLLLSFTCPSQLCGMVYITFVAPPSCFLIGVVFILFFVALIVHTRKSRF